MARTSSRGMLILVTALVAATAVALLPAPPAHSAGTSAERLELMREALPAANGAPGEVEAQQVASTCVADPADDVVDDRTDTAFAGTEAPRADIVEHCAAYSDNLVLQVSVEEPTNPNTDAAWQDATFVGWFLDTTGDDTGDFFVSYNLDEDGNLHSEVQRLENEEGVVTCTGHSAVFDGESYTAGPIPPACIDDATSVEASAAVFYDLGEDAELLHDVAPDGGGFATAVERAAVCDAPLPAPFADRDEIAEVHREPVDCLFSRGITLGTISDDIRTFQPRAGITRGQFAGFTFRGLDATGTELPEAQTPRFTDVPDAHTFDEEIHRLAAAEILLGQTPTVFDPNGLIRRDQTASVLLRSLEFVRGEEIAPDNPGTYFADTTTNFHRLNIDAAFEEGLVEGVVAPNADLGLYIPSFPTSRQQMASVVHRFVDTVESSP